VSASYGPVVGLEEHVVLPEVVDAWRTAPDLAWEPSTQGRTGAALADLGGRRLEEMDRVGLDVAVLSLSTPGLAQLDAGPAMALQERVNDRLAEVVRSRPDRYGALATLATPDPDAAARELERAVVDLGLDGAMVFGRSGGRHLADQTALLEAADALRAPLYLHPQTPPPGVRAAYYDGLDVSAAYATHGLGWHYDAGVELVRLALSGALDRFPDLRVVTGHWGEVVLFYLERIDQLGDVSRRLAEHLWVTPSGMLSHRYLRWTSEVLGPERVMVATDHPFVPLEDGAVRTFLDAADLTDDQRTAIAHGTWDCLRADIHR
jgi:uncharacterized protein